MMYINAMFCLICLQLTKLGHSIVGFVEEKWNQDKYPVAPVILFGLAIDVMFPLQAIEAISKKGDLPPRLAAEKFLCPDWNVRDVYISLKCISTLSLCPLG